MVRRGRFELPESFDTRFTVWTATNYGLPTHSLEEDRRIERLCFTTPWGSDPVADHSAVSSVCVARFELANSLRASWFQARRSNQTELHTDIGARIRNRTGDIRLTRTVLCQLSYSGILGKRTGFEPVSRGATTLCGSLFAIFSIVFFPTLISLLDDKQTKYNQLMQQQFQN